LRKGEPLPSVQRPGPQAGALVAVPLFHVTGSTSYSVCSIFLKPWHGIMNPFLFLDDGHIDGHEDNPREEMDS
jgi:hypothetical protein